MSQTLEGHAPLKGCLAASHKNRGPVSCSSLPQMASPPGRPCGKCPDVARLHHQRAEETWRQALGVCRAVSVLRLLFCTLSWSMQKPAAPLKPRGGTACVHIVVCGMKLADPGTTTEPRGPTASQSRPADIFTATAVPGRSAALDVCVASSVAAAARGDAAQAAIGRKLTHSRNEIGELRQPNIHHRPPVWTADGRPHPAFTRTLQYAADVASSRNGQHQSAKSLHRRWKHGTQIALLQRRAAMARAVSPEPLCEGGVALRRHH